MTAVGNGQWRRIYRGKPYYFGTWDDPKAAFERWKAEWPLITGGNAEDRKAPTGSATVHGVCTEFLNSYEAKVARGDRSNRSYRVYREIGAKLVKLLGQSTYVSQLTPRLFGRVMEKISAEWGVHRRTNFVVYTRAIFKWAKDSRLIDRLPEYGPDFRAPPRAIIRQHKQATKRTRLTPDDLVMLLGAADPQMRLMILLGISCGFGPTDVATLRAADVNLNTKLIDYTRHKTAMPRVSPLWPHAVDLFRSILRPGRDLVFIQESSRFRGWDYNDELVTKQFRRLVQWLGINASFYDLRRTFATVANGARDKDAARVIMGQRVESVFDDYVQDASPVPVERLTAVSDYVRAWVRLPHPSDGLSPASSP